MVGADSSVHELCADGFEWGDAGVQGRQVVLDVPSFRDLASLGTLLSGLPGNVGSSCPGVLKVL